MDGLAESLASVPFECQGRDVTQYEKLTSGRKLWLAYLRSHPFWLLSWDKILLHGNDHLNSQAACYPELEPWGRINAASDCSLWPFCYDHLWIPVERLLSMEIKGNCASI